MFTSFWNMFECADDGERDILKPTPSQDVCSLPECDYDTNCTALYRQIQIKNWTAVNQYLLTGYWSGAFFADNSPPSEQACTWVTKYEKKDKKKRVMWTHLPIHAAMIYGAPDGVVKMLINISRATLRCADDRRMLPLHLAFAHGSSDMVLGMVLDVFPEAVVVRDFKGRTPAECAGDGPNCKRGQIISTVLFYNKKTWEKKAAKAQNKQLDSIRQALGNRNERVSHLETAMDLIRCREDQARDSFSLVVAEIEKLKHWYEEKEAEAALEDGEPLDADFVKNVALKLNYLQAYAEQLVIQQTQAKEDSDKTLSDLNAVWGDNKNAPDVPVRSFDAKKSDKKKAKAAAPVLAATPVPPTPLASIAHQQDQHSDVSSHTSLETRSTKGMDAAAPAAEEEKKEETASLISRVKNEASLASIKEASVEGVEKIEAPVAPIAPVVAPIVETEKQEDPLVALKKKVEKDDDSLTIPSEFKDDVVEEVEEAPPAPVPEKKPMVVVKKEEPIEVDPNAPVLSVEVPGDDEVDEDESIERELQMAISEMTSLDMSETTDMSKTSSKITRMLSFGKRLNKITKRASKAAAALDTNKTLPPKMLDSSEKSTKSNKGRVITKPRKVAPTM